MNASISVQGLEKVTSSVRNAGKQVRFAAANAVNATAREVQSHTTGKLLKDRFTLRAKGQPWQKPGSRFGINIRPFANKQSLRAIVGSQADWLRLHDVGGVKQVSGHRIAVPTQFWKSREEIMKREKKPRAILARETKRSLKLKSELIKAESQAKTIDGRKHRSDKRKLKAQITTLRSKLRVAESSRKLLGSLINKPFTATINGKGGIFIRTSKERGPLKALFWFEPATRIKAVLKFYEENAEVVRKVYARNFGKAIAEAFATAK